ncbi:MAG: hypothetical protein Q9163_005859 [Psora crenata]
MLPIEGGKGIPDAYNPDSFSTSANHLPQNVGEGLDSLDEGHRNLSHSTAGNSDPATPLNAVVLASTSTPEECGPSSSQNVADTARSNTPARTTNPQTPSTRVGMHESIQRHCVEHLVEVYEPIAFYTKSGSPATFHNTQAPVTHVSSTQLVDVSNAAISSGRRTLSRRVLGNVPEVVRDDNYVDGPPKECLRAPSMETSHGNQRPSDRPIEQSCSIGSSSAVQDSPLSGGQAPARRASTGGTTSSRLRGDAPSFVPSSQIGFRSDRPVELDTASVSPPSQYTRPAIPEKIVKSPKQRPQSCLPSKLSVGSPQLFLTSELYARGFDARKRSTLTHIFRTKATFVPACVGTFPQLPSNIVYYLSKPTASPRAPRDLPLGPGRRGWPVGQVPVELFNAITDYLPYESMQAMRLVNREFEMKTSGKYFRSVVVPFRHKIYGMMTGKEVAANVQNIRLKGKSKASCQLFDSEEEEKTLDDGMKLFEARGPCIERFGMAFEVDDAALENAPVKGKFERHTTWWGWYEWPHTSYNRYAFCEGLEKKADEFTCMSKALSFLVGTKELGLSVDSGLGWLVGPDISDRAKLARAKPQVFGRRRSQTPLGISQVEEVWHGVANFPDRHPVLSSAAHVQGGFLDLEVNCSGEQRTVRPKSTDEQIFRRPLIADDHGLSTILQYVQHQDTILDSPRTLDDSSPNRFATAPLKPNKLTVAQREWLLETEWAQRAFLSTFCMALADNSRTFQQVHTLNISRLSSRYLSALGRKEWWGSLPNLSRLTIYVSADWRNIWKYDTGMVTAPMIPPSKAARQFYAILKNHVADIPNIKTLSIGYVGGGEHQVGIFGRNKSILPAPLIDYSDSTAIFKPVEGLLTFPHVEELTFSNCWMTPGTLKNFAAPSRLAKLRFLNLRSVSLTSGFPILKEAIDINSDSGTFETPQGPPRRGCPTVGNFFQQWHWGIPDPAPTGWAVKGQRVESWGNVIDAITPGATMDFIRYVFQYRDKPPAPRITNLHRISFESCGYVHLKAFRGFPQHAIDEPGEAFPPYVLNRVVDLFPYMMDCSRDLLLGRIVPALKPEEVEVFTSAFPMRLGWPREDFEKSLYNAEDGQLPGGTGRFSGDIEKLVLR